MAQSPPFAFAPMLAQASWSGLIVGGTTMLSLGPRLPGVSDPRALFFAGVMTAMFLLGLLGVRKIGRWTAWLSPRSPEDAASPALRSMVNVLGGVTLVAGALVFGFGLLMLAFVFVSGLLGHGGHAQPAAMFMGLVALPCLLFGHVMFWVGRHWAVRR